MMLGFLPFFKMSGCGNNFIIINNTKLRIKREYLPNIVRQICCRHLSVGGDGAIFVEESDVVDFKWIFFNSDGFEADMCGNGARCVAKYAFVNNIADRNMFFETNIGILSAKVKGHCVKISMVDPNNIKLYHKIEINKSTLVFNSVNVGVPHVVIFVNDLNDFDVIKIGKNICNHSMFYPDRTNVNFVEVLNPLDIFIRTYERGVDNETMSCGTGSIAAAIMCAIHHQLNSPISLTNFSGNKLKIFFKKKNKVFKEVFLEGEARILYTGVIWKEGWGKKHMPIFQ